MGPDSSLTPDQIQGRNFDVVFRGYDQGEVKAYLARIASELRAWRERAENLESAWHSAEERAARPPVLDEDTLMAAVGEETASILRSARSAAADMRAKSAEEAGRLVDEARQLAERLVGEAREEADRLLQEAHLEADGTTQQAERALAEATAAAEEAAAQVAAEAAREAEELLSRARADAEATRAEAAKEHQLTVEGANTTRDRILEDLSRRRRIATVQIEQLRAGRERLIESYAVVRRTLEEATAELGRADAEARAAADEVGRRLRDEVDVDLSGDRLPDLPPVPERVPESALPDSPLEEVVSSAVDELFARIRGTQPADEATADEGSVPEASAAGTPTAEHPVVVDVGAAAVAGPAQGSARASGDPAVRRPGSGRRNGSARAPEKRPGKRKDGPDRPAADSPAADAQSAEAAPATDDAAADVAASTTDPGVELSDADESLMQRRESAVVDLEVTLTRRLKRALQDEQNDVLDRLRSLRGEPTTARLLPSPEQQASRFADAANPLLERAAAAGATFASEVLGGGKGEHRSGPAKVDDLAADTASVIAGGLRRRLDEVISAGAGEDPAVLVESLGSAYREWKNQRMERLAGDVLCAAFSRGTWNATPPGARLRWLAEDIDGPCPDCDDDALAGALPKGEAFPTGQDHPPAHSGCRCLLIPVEAG